MTRQPAVSGSFYPAFQSALRAQIQCLLEDVKPVLSQPPKMLIVPHAGYLYSGAIAAAAYQQLSPFADLYRQVVIAGPAHRVGFDGIALSTATAFSTPLGSVPVDYGHMAVDDEVLLSFDDAHLYEHSLEVQLPFLQTLLSNFSIAPLVVGKCPATTVQRCFQMLWGKADTLWVISTDLSHFLAYPDAQRMDNHTIDRILAEQTDLSGNDACGHYPLNGALALAQHKNLSIREMARCNSGDINGQRDRVVGYASFVLTSPGAEIETKHN